jgi:hypothetical protein
VFGYLAQRIGLVSIVGFLAAGVLIGPNALGWIDDLVLVEQMGEIGVIFLMFFIGLELSGEMLKKMGSLLFGGGAVQVGLTIALVTVIGVVFGVNTKSAVYTGCLVALSSTAVVLKMLSSRNETNTPTGEVAVAPKCAAGHSLGPTLAPAIRKRSPAMSAPAWRSIRRSPTSPLPTPTSTTPTSRSSKKPSILGKSPPTNEPMAAPQRVAPREDRKCLK